MDFNPPSPCGEGPLGRGPVYKKREFQSTLPVWGGTRAPTESTPPAVFQSTLPVWGGTCSAANFLLSARFQSTLPVWGGTWKCTKEFPYKERISIHPPRVGRDDFVGVAYLVSRISIHPPRVGRDFLASVSGNRCKIFQSTLPVWGGTRLLVLAPGIAIPISIHPPRVGRDSKSSQKFFVNFCARR